MRGGRHSESVTVALVAAGGALGGLARAAVAAGLPPSHGWPVATLGVNLLGAALLGALLGHLEATSTPAGRWLRPLLGTGLLGGFTTFSAFAVESTTLLDGGRGPTALAYVLLTLVGGTLLAGLASTVTAHRAGDDGAA